MYVILFDHFNGCSSLIKEINVNMERIVLTFTIEKN